MSPSTPFGLEDSSTYKVHQSFPGVCTSCKSLTKSAKNWALMGLRGSYRVLNSDNSRAHADILPARLGF